MGCGTDVGWWVLYVSNVSAEASHACDTVHVCSGTKPMYP